MARILLIEDSPEWQVIVRRSFDGLGHELALEASIAAAQINMRNNPPDLILLDLTLPDGSGFDLFMAIQSDKSLAAIPVVFLTGKSEVTDKVAAFSLGAEDYIVKPFNPMEFRARIEAKLKKISQQRESSRLLRQGPLLINIDSQGVCIDEGETTKKIDLTTLEFRLLCVLVRAPDRIFTRDQLLVEVWGNDAEVYDRTIDTHICGLRKKLGPLGSKIVSVRNSGYKFEPIAR